LVNVAVLGKPALEKESTGWISVAAPPPASSPVPVRRIGISGFAEVLIRVRYALRVPVAEGLKVNSKLQDVLGITGVEQPPSVAKSSGFAPENEGAISIPTGLAVLLVKVTIKGAEVVKFLVEGKFNVEGDTVKPEPEVTVRLTLRSGGTCGWMGWNGAVSVARL
jgi:hypothetical protein